VHDEAWLLEQIAAADSDAGNEKPAAFPASDNSGISGNKAGDANGQLSLF
jgi:DNA ligase (NAD+)